MNSTAVEIEKLKQLSEANSNSNYISIYTSKKQQNLSNIPILKPLLIIILSGCKVIGNKTKLACNTGDFIFFYRCSVNEHEKYTRKYELFCITY